MKKLDAPAKDLRDAEAPVFQPHTSVGVPETIIDILFGPDLPMLC
jgi:hypothetical protein